MTALPTSWNNASFAIPQLTTRAQWVFAGAMAVLCLHFLDASIVHPQAGATPIEHLLQALLAVAAPPLTLFAYVVAGRWVRGLGSIAIGLPATATGVAIHVVGPIKNGHMHAGDYSGIAMAVAGLALVVLGTGTLVRIVPKIRYRFALLLIAPFAFYWVVIPIGAGIYITHAPRYERHPIDMGAPHEDVHFETADGLTIFGSYVPSTNGATVIVAHGSGGARHRPQDHIQMLVRNGYGVLAIDSRGHGESDGTTNALGWGAYRDIPAAAEYLAGRPEVDGSRIGVLGISMGGEIALDAATHGAPVAAFISDGAGSRSINETLSLPRTWADIVGLPTVAELSGVVTALARTMPPPSLESQVDQITAPVFFIASKNIGDERELNRIWEKKTNAEHEWWEVDAGHTEGLSKFPDEYERRVISFLNAHLLGE
ncbi:MAG: alpha/beta hydrolase [Dehalococcoidia bacterium]